MDFTSWLQLSYYAKLLGDDLEPEVTRPSISLVLAHYSKISTFFSDSNINSPLKGSSKSVEELRIKGHNDFDFPLTSWSQSWKGVTVTYQQ